MTSNEPPSPSESLPTKRCRACEHDVRAAPFCGVCGAALSRQDGRRPARLRIRAYSAAPREHVLRPSLVTSLFPQLPRRSRPAFGLGLLVLAVLLVALVLLRWQPPLIGISALGLPLLFIVYLKQTDSFDELPAATLAVAGVLGVSAGIGWARATDAIWARTYDDVLATPMTTVQALMNLVLVPACGVLVMLLPVVVVRLWRPGARKSLSGFAIGAFAGLCFTAAGTLTRAAPEFANGLVVPDYPMDALAALAAIRGVAAPLTAIAVGGLVGATLWFRQRADAHDERHWYSLTSPAPAVTVALLAYLGQNGIDFAWISYTQIVGLYAAITVLALLALRITLQTNMLGEGDAGISPTKTALCPECDRVVPDQSFCVNCGIAADAAWRTSSRVPSVHRTSLVYPLLLLGSALAVVMATTIGLSRWLTPAPANYSCPPDCGRPPLGQPVTTNPRFTPADGAFSVSYPGPGTAYDATLESNGVIVELHAGDGGTLQLIGEPAANRTPRQIADELIGQAFPDAATAYEIPNAMVGYQLGYGVVADVYKAGSAGDSARLRVLVMVAVKNDVALIAAAAGPYREFTPDFGSGHPSGANFFLALDMGKYVNSFTWRGDPPR